MKDQIISQYTMSQNHKSLKIYYLNICDLVTITTVYKLPKITY